jgi:hypothetical protein
MEEEIVKEIESGCHWDRGGQISAGGEIQNISTNKTLTSVKALITFFDAQGKIVETNNNSTQPDTLKPGEKARYHIRTPAFDSLYGQDLRNIKTSYSWAEI